MKKQHWILLIVALVGILALGCPKAPPPPAPPGYIYLEIPSADKGTECRFPMVFFGDWMGTDGLGGLFSSTPSGYVVKYNYRTVAFIPLSSTVVKYANTKENLRKILQEWPTAKVVSYDDTKEAR